jgi:hypothetical protein
VEAVCVLDESSPVLSLELPDLRREQVPACTGTHGDHAIPDGAAACWAYREGSPDCDGYADAVELVLLRADVGDASAFLIDWPACLDAM